VMRVQVRFAEWLRGTFEADAFVDTGADNTMLSYRWAQKCRQRAAVARREIPPPYPLLDGSGYVMETASVRIAPRSAGE